MPKRLLALGAIALMLAACSGDRNPATDSVSARGDNTLADPKHGSNDHGEDPAATKSAKKESKPTEADAVDADPASDKPSAVDPRQGGFEIALGEWAVTPEAAAIRPGEVTFLISNRGTVPHGFEIELEGESSGSGSGDLFKAESELLQPGESTRMTVQLTRTGVYKIECLVDGHDDMGMEGPLAVSADAPLIEKTPAKTTAEKGEDAEVAIADFTFEPSKMEVTAGTKVTWSNDDPAPHTVTALDGAFDSGTMDAGKAFSFIFDERGTYDYRCNVHPDMKGTVEVR